MAKHNMTISAKARPGDLSRKNRADHATFSNNCSRNSRIGPPVTPTFRQTNQAAIAIAMNKIVQTGPNSELGGVQLGLLRPAYHDRSAGVVSNDPSPAAPRQTTIQTISRIRGRYTNARSKAELSFNIAYDLVKLFRQRRLFAKEAAQGYSRHLCFVALHAADSHAVVTSRRAYPAAQRLHHRHESVRNFRNKIFLYDRSRRHGLN